MQSESLNPKNEVVLGLGSNLGNRLYNLDKAVYLLNEKVGKVVSASSVYWSAPWGDSNLRPFLNMVLVIKTSLLPRELLRKLENIEIDLGRKSDKGQFKNRPIDIDILFFGKTILDDENLKIPHPGISSRRFVLEPLVEIKPDLIHPVLKKSAKELLIECKDDLAVHLWGS